MAYVAQKENFPGKVFANLGVAGHRLNATGGRIQPKGMLGAFPFEPAAVGLQMPEQVTAFHQTKTQVCSAPRGAFSRLCSRR